MFTNSRYRMHGVSLHNGVTWGMVKRSTLGQKNSIPVEPYLRWVRARARELVMPYLAVEPLIVEPEVEGGTP
ncbi:hypothetical protein KIW84_031207 [Lathyrus oleraceus]|uniref:Uncharacterized protein n=1 Tax=Pisum sativum TaxID=3888 RepID=A0A9D5B0I8_PEA|nr:hypothetical protein KIW84_031207 [Pisum sativum]